MYSIIAKNITDSDKFIDDLGINISSLSEVELSTIFKRSEIATSNDLKTYVTNSEIVINNGIEDLSVQEGLKHITFETTHEDNIEEDYPYDEYYEPGPVGPILSGYTSAIKLTIDHDQVSGSINLTDFPMLVDITFSGLMTIGNGGDVESSDGYDIIFIGDDSTSVLDHEIELYDPSEGRIIMWVRIPILSYDEDTIIYINYGNSNVTTSQENVSGTFSSNFELVHHMNDTSGTITDSLGNHHSSSETGMTYERTGKLNKSILFDEIDDYYTIADFDYGDTFTISLWLKVTDNAGSYYQYFYSHDVFNTNPSIIMLIHESGDVSPGSTNINFRDNVSSNENLIIDPTGGDINLGDGEWHLIHCIRVRNGTSRVMIDGEEQETYSSPDTDIDPTGAINIGRREDGDANRYFGGNLEELRIVSTNRTVAWCITEYNNQNSPNSFYNVEFQASLDEVEAGIIQTNSLDGGVSVNNITPVAVPFTNVIFKDPYTYTYDVTTNNTRIYFDKQGVYQLNYFMSWYIITDNGDAHIRTRIRINGSTYVDYSTTYNPISDPNHIYGQNTNIIFLELNADDYIEIMCDRQGSAANVYTLPENNIFLAELYQEY